MPNAQPQLAWPPADSEEFVRVLCLFAEHLSADELRGGLLLQIRVHGRPLLEHLEKLILSERIADPAARAAVVAAVGWAGQARSTTAIRAALGDRAADVLRVAARAAWSDLRQPRLVPRLLELLADANAEPDVVAAAAESLSHFRVKQALGPMVRMALARSARFNDDEREQLLTAISRLAAVNFGDPAELTLRQRLTRLRIWWREADAG